MKNNNGLLVLVASLVLAQAPVAAAWPVKLTLSENQRTARNHVLAHAAILALIQALQVGATAYKSQETRGIDTRNQVEKWREVFATIFTSKEAWLEHFATVKSIVTRKGDVTRDPLLGGAVVGYGLWKAAMGAYALGTTGFYVVKGVKSVRASRAEAAKAARVAEAAKQAAGDKKLAENLAEMFGSQDEDALMSDADIEVLEAARQAAKAQAARLEQFKAARAAEAAQRVEMQTKVAAAKNERQAEALRQECEDLKANIRALSGKDVSDLPDDRDSLTDLLEDLQKQASDLRAALKSATPSAKRDAFDSFSISALEQRLKSIAKRGEAAKIAALRVKLDQMIGAPGMFKPESGSDTISDLEESVRVVQQQITELQQEAQDLGLSVEGLPKKFVDLISCVQHRKALCDSVASESADGTAAQEQVEHDSALESVPVGGVPSTLCVGAAQENTAAAASSSPVKKKDRKKKKPTSASEQKVVFASISGGEARPQGGNVNGQNLKYLVVGGKKTKEIKKWVPTRSSYGLGEWKTASKEEAAGIQLLMDSGKIKELT